MLHELDIFKLTELFKVFDYTLLNLFNYFEHSGLQYSPCASYARSRSPVDSGRRELEWCFHSGVVKSNRCIYFSLQRETMRWEILAVSLAMQEWRHWPEGAKHQVLIWTVQKNLTYVFCLI